MAESEHTYEYGEIPLPAFPHIGAIPVARDEEGRVWFPVRPICEGLGLANAAQQAKIQGDDTYERWRRLVPFGTARGSRDYLSVEFDGLGYWLGGIQEQRANDESAAYIAVFRQAVWSGSNRILWSGKTAAMVTGRRTEPPRLGSAQAAGPARTVGARIIEERVTYLEDAVAMMVNGNMDTEHSASCPHCGGPILIHTGPVRVLKR
jgi:P22_AR N-terminal domain